MWQGAIDCDFHPRVPSPRVLSRYMNDFWRETVEVRGIDTWDFDLLSAQRAAYVAARLAPKRGRCRSGQRRQGDT